MGKQSKRPRRRKPKTSTKDNSLDQKEGAGKVVDRLRHGDPRVRDAALSALSCTIFSPEGLLENTNATKNKKSKRYSRITEDLMKCLLERVIDSDVSVSMNATGCLNNFITFSSPDQVDVLFANGMDVVLVLMTRLSRCCHAVSTKQDIEWELAAICAQTLSALTYNNKLCVDRLTDLTLIDQQPLVNTLFRLLDLANSSICENQKDNIQTAMIYASQSLHSLLDENQILVHHLLSLDIVRKVLLPSVLNESHPLLARLHLAGAITTTYQIQSQPFVFEICTSRVIPLLCTHLVFDPNDIRIMAEEIRTTGNKIKAEQEDEELERDIIRKVNSKKESPRAIAKRQKEGKLKKEACAKEKKTDDMDMECDNQEAPKKIHDVHESKNLEEQHEFSIQCWNKYFSAVKLALEISTNLCSNVADEQDAMEYTTTDKTQLNLPASLDRNSALFKYLASSSLPDRVIQLIKSVYLHLPFLTENSQKHDVIQLQSKAAACLLNIVSNFPTSPFTISLFSDLIQMPPNSNITPILLSILQMHQTVRTNMQTSYFQTIMSFLTDKHDLEVQRDAVAMVAALCKEPHSRQTNYLISSTLVALLPNADLGVQNEIFNFFMDVYSHDEMHMDVFQELKLNAFLEGSLPSFQRATSNIQHHEDNEMWQETAFNLVRFIDYKKSVNGQKVVDVAAVMKAKAKPKEKSAAEIAAATAAKEAKAKKEKADKLKKKKRKKKDKYAHGAPSR